MRKVYHLSVLVPGILFCSTSNAAKFISIDDTNFQKYINLQANALSISNHDGQIILDKTIKLSNGLVKKKYIQKYQNIPIFDSVISSSDINGIQNDWFGKILTDIAADLPDTKPKFSALEAMAKAKEAWKISQKTPVTSEEVRLIIVPNKEANVAELVYLVSFFVDTNKPQRPFILLNAKNGKIIDKWNGLTTKEGNGPGGNKKTGQYNYGKEYGPMILNDTCQMSNTNVTTYNLNGQTSGGSIFKLTNCPNDTTPAVNTYKQINGAFSPLNDAHYFGGVVFNMYEKWYKIEPLGKGVRLNVQVHYGQNFENAFWDGQRMAFGDGGSYIYPLTALDVMGHEVSHGVTEKTSGLIYKYQSGGMNEAFSDMAGETAEFYMKNEIGEENDWMIGSSIMKTIPAMRYFDNPSRDGQSIEHAKDYNDSLDVHFTSGVYNKAFYTLAKKPQWGIRKAFEVFLTANRIYWTPNATFDSGACGVAKASQDLGYEVADVVASFKMVGVNANCGVPNPDPDPDPTQEIEIKNGQTISNIKVSAGKDFRFVIKVPSLPSYPYRYKYLYLTLSDGQSTVKNLAEMYVRWDIEGVSGGIQKLVPKVEGKDEVFYINYPSSGYYHILIRGKADANLNLYALYGN